MPTLATRISAQPVLVPLFDAQPEPTPTPHSIASATSPNDTYEGIRFVIAMLLLLLFAKLVACWRSWRLSDRLAFLMLLKELYVIPLVFMPKVDPNTSTQNRGGLGGRDASNRYCGALGDKDHRTPLEKLLDR